MNDLIRVGKIPNRFGEGDKTHPKIEGFENINVTSASRGKYSKLSPMKLGPFVITEKMVNNAELGYVNSGNGYQSANIIIFENYWQGSKIYREDLIDGISLTVDNLKKSFFERRAKMYADTKPHRRALPKIHGLPIAGYYNCQIFDYVPSRKIYVHCYMSLVNEREEYKELVNKYLNGKKLHIIGYDGRDIGYITKESIVNAYYNKNEIFGHELVLVGMITNTLPNIH